GPACAIAELSCGDGGEGVTASEGIFAQFLRVGFFFLAFWFFGVHGVGCFVFLVVCDIGGLGDFGDVFERGRICGQAMVVGLCVRVIGIVLRIGRVGVFDGGDDLLCGFIGRVCGCADRLNFYFGDAFDGLDEFFDAFDLCFVCV